MTNRFPTRIMLRTLQVFLTIFVCTVGAANAYADLQIFDGSAVKPYQLLVGDKKNWGVPVTTGSAVSVAGYVNVVETDDGVISATWNGKGEAQLYLNSEQSQDFSDFLATDAALVVHMKVSKVPKKPVSLRMGCGFPCSASAEVGKLLKALPADEWIRISFDLQCFVGGGLEVGHVDTPFLLITRSKLSVEIADVRIVSGAGPTATIKCR